MPLTSHHRPQNLARNLRFLPGGLIQALSLPSIEAQRFRVTLGMGPALLNVGTAIYSAINPLSRFCRCSNRGPYGV